MRSDYTPWTSEEEAKLGRLHASGYDVKEIAARMSRSIMGIHNRLSKLGLGISQSDGGWPKVIRTGDRYGDRRYEDVKLKVMERVGA